MSELIDKVVSLSIAVTIAVVESVVFFIKLPTWAVVLKFCVLSTNLLAVVEVALPLSNSSNNCSLVKVYLL